MRAHDPGIGLAVAWARWNGNDHLWSTGAIALRLDAREVAIYGHRVITCWCDRGPVAEPEPLTDMRVAFGIAMAQRGPWKVCPHRGAGRPPCYLQAFRGHGHIVDAGDHIMSDGRLGHKYVEMEPRRWLRQRSTP